MHHVLKANDMVAITPEAFTTHSTGFTRIETVGQSAGSVHMGFGVCALEPGGRINEHVQSYEESVFVLAGEPTLAIEGTARRLRPGDCGLVPVGVPHALSADHQGARWLEMVSPPPRQSGPADLFFTGGVAPQTARSAVDARDPRVAHRFFHLSEREMHIDSLKVGAPVDAPTVSASMASALLAYSGIAVKMLIDQRLGAALHTMFMVEYQPGGVAQPHDHPLEESYFILDGEVEAQADGERITLRAGDALWTAVGCIHAFYNTSGTTVRWLETSSPQPPARHSYRFDRDWDYLAATLRSGRE